MTAPAKLLPLPADVDECSERADEDLSCDHHCHNYLGGFYCSCRYGYLLHSDKRTCRGEAEGAALAWGIKGVFVVVRSGSVGTF